MAIERRHGRQVSDVDRLCVLADTAVFIGGREPDDVRPIIVRCETQTRIRAAGKGTSVLRYNPAAVKALGRVEGARVHYRSLNRDRCTFSAGCRSINTDDGD